MKSRMEKYYKDEELMQRTSRNDALYDKLYREKQMPRSNVTVIDNVNEIDITKIKTMVDSREKYKRVREYENIVNPMDTYRKSQVEYNFDEIDDSNYDINEIIKNKRSDNLYKSDSSRIRRLTNKEYEILSNLEVSRDDIKMSEDLINHEKQLVDLFNTVSRTAVSDATDLFSNLKEEEAPEKAKEEEFYTNTTKFENEDFFDDVKDSSNSKTFIIIGIISVLIALAVIIYIKFFN